MTDRVRVILITDGDRVAQQAIEEIACELNLRCISASAGTPTPISGPEIVQLLKTVQRDPVIVMFDDRGSPLKGKGELAIEYVANHPDIEVIGAVAVASNSFDFQGAQVDFCVDKNGELTKHGVDKYGDKMIAVLHEPPVVLGDTVDILNEIDVPVIIGIGDIGKMRQRDAVYIGAPVTKCAILEILKRNGI